MLKFKENKLHLNGLNTFIDENGHVVAEFMSNGLKDGKLHINSFFGDNFDVVRQMCTAIFQNDGIKGLMVTDIGDDGIDFWHDISGDIIVDASTKTAFIPNIVGMELDEKKWSERSAIYNPDDTMVQRGPANPLFKESMNKKYIISENQLIRTLLSSGNMEIFNEISKQSKIIRNKLEAIQIGEILDDLKGSRENLRRMWQNSSELQNKTMSVHKQLVDQASNAISDDDEFHNFEMKVDDISNKVTAHLEMNQDIIDSLEDMIDKLVD